MTEVNPVIRLEEVSVSYRIKTGIFKWQLHTPLENISFYIYKGETLGVIGRNGVGKSSLLRVIAGIVAPDSGKIHTHCKNITLLSLGAGFVPHLTGRENVMLSGMLMGMSKKEIKSKMDEIINFAEIHNFIDRPLQTYSSGMRSRIGFAAAIQANPDVLLIDEILGVGDETFKAKSTAAMKSLIRSDKTVVLVSHQLAVVRELCDRIVWLDGSKVRYIGPTEEGLELYKNNHGVK